MSHEMHGGTSCAYGPQRTGGNAGLECIPLADRLLNQRAVAVGLGVEIGVQRLRRFQEKNVDTVPSRACKTHLIESVHGCAERCRSNQQGNACSTPCDVSSLLPECAQSRTRAAKTDLICGHGERAGHGEEDSAGEVQCRGKDAQDADVDLGEHVRQ